MATQDLRTGTEGAIEELRHIISKYFTGTQSLIASPPEPACFCNINGAVHSSTVRESNSTNKTSNAQTYGIDGMSSKRALRKLFIRVSKYYRGTQPTTVSPFERVATDITGIKTETADHIPFGEFYTDSLDADYHREKKYGGAKSPDIVSSFYTRACGDLLLFCAKCTFSINPCDELYQDSIPLGEFDTANVDADYLRTKKVSGSVSS